MFLNNFKRQTCRQIFLQPNRKIGKFQNSTNLSGKLWKILFHEILNIFSMLRFSFSSLSLSWRDPKPKKWETQRETKFADNLIRPTSLKSLCPACACSPADDSKNRFLACTVYFQETCDSDLCMPGWLSQFRGWVQGKQPLIISAGGALLGVLTEAWAHSHFCPPTV